MRIKTGQELLQRVKHQTAYKKIFLCVVQYLDFFQTQLLGTHPLQWLGENVYERSEDATTNRDCRLSPKRR